MSKYTPQSGIYIIKNVKSGKVYIGQAQHIRVRWVTHKRKLANNKHDNSHLQRAWNKHGASVFKFQILEYCPIEQLDEREQHYLDIYMPKGICYNIAIAVDSPTRGRKLTNEHKQKISNANKNPSAETRARISNANKGKVSPNRGVPLTAETKRKLSESKQGHRVSFETREKLSKANMGNKQHLGFKHSEEAKKKMSLSHNKIPNEVIGEIRDRYAQGDITHQKLATEYGISRAMVGLIVRCKRRNYQ